MFNPTVIIALFVLLSIVTVVGHAIWVLLAWAIRNLSGSGGLPPSDDQAEASSDSSRHRQEALSSSSSSIADDRARVVVRELLRLQRAGRLSSETVREILQALKPDKGSTPVVAQLVEPPRAEPTAGTGADRAAEESLFVGTTETDKPLVPAERQHPAETRSAPAGMDERPAWLESEQEQEAVPEAPHERVSWTDWFASFLEERNIRWGEMVGGLLIVGCSLALVISFWSEIAERPLLKFSVFNGVSVALFGIGLYASKRWNLPSTSRGILTIASVLVPLQLLAIASFSQGGSASAWVSLVAEGMSVALFTALLYFAARVITGELAVWTAGGTIVPAAWQLVAARYAVAQTDAVAAITTIYLLLSVPSLAYLSATAFPVRLLQQRVGRLPDEAVNRLLKHLGVSTFSVAVCVGLILLRVHPDPVVAAWTAPFLALATLPWVLIGNFLWSGYPKNERAVEHQFVGASLVVAWALALAASVFIAWPQPGPLAVTASLVLLGATVGAFWMGAVWLHGAAVASLFVLTTIVYCVLSSQVDWTVGSSQSLLVALRHPFTAQFWLPLALSVLIVGALLRRIRLRDVAQFYTVGGLAIVVSSASLLALSTLGTAPDPYYASWFLLAESAILIAAGFLTIGGYRWAGVSIHLGAILAVASLVQGYAYGGFPWKADAPIAAVGLTMASIMLPWSIVFRRFGGFAPADTATSAQGTTPMAVEPASCCYKLAELIALWAVAGLSAGIVFAFIAWWTAIGFGPWYFLWSLLLTVALGSLQPNRISLGVVEIVLGVTAVAIADMLLQQHWETLQWADRWQWPRLAWYGVALAASSWVGCGAEWGRRRLASRIDGPLPATWPILAHSWGTAAGLAMAACVTLAIVPGVLIVDGFLTELSPMEVRAPTRWIGERYTDRSLPACWVLVLFSVARGVYQRRLSRARWVDVMVLLPAITVPFLLALSWSDQLAVASATLWITSGMLLVGATIACAVRAVRVRRRPSMARPREGPVWSLVDRWIQRELSWIMALLLFPWLLALAIVYVRAVQSGPLRVWTPGLWQFGGCGLFVVLFLGLLAFSQRPDQEGKGYRDGCTVAAFAAALFVASLVLGGAIAQVAYAWRFAGPLPDSLFAGMPAAVRYGVPAAAFWGALLGYEIAYGVRRGTALASVLAGPLSVFAYLLCNTQRAAEPAGQLDMLSLFAAFLALWAMVVLLRESHGRRTSVGQAMALPAVVVAVTCAVGAVLFVLGPVFEDPLRPPPEPGSFAPLAWLALGMVAVTVVAAFRTSGPSSPVILAAHAVAIGFAGQATIQWSEPLLGPLLGRWVEHHGLIAMVAMLGLATALIAAMHDRWQHASSANSVASTLWAHEPARIVHIGTLIWLAVVGWRKDPTGVAWSLAALSAAALVGVDAAWRHRRMAYVAVAGGLINVLASVWWLEVGHQFFRSHDLGKVIDLLRINAMALALPIPLWVVLERRTVNLGQRRYPVALGLAELIGGMSSLVVLASLGSGIVSSADVRVAWMMVLAMAIGNVGYLWSRPMRGRPVVAYWFGLLSVAVVLESLKLQQIQLLWVSTLFLSAYGLFVAAIAGRWDRWRRARWATRVPALQVPAANGRHFIAGLSCFLATVVAVLGIWAEFTCDDLGLRITGSQAIAAQVVALALLANGRGETLIRHIALALVSIAAVAFAWAWVDPAVPGVRYLPRLVGAWVALATVAVVFVAGLMRLAKVPSLWVEAARQQAPVLLAAATASLVAVLSAEVYLFWQAGRAVLSPVGIALVFISLVGAAGTTLLVALHPDRDPLGLSQTRREIYVYASELLAALSFLHVRLTLPHWFSGFFQQYWSLLVVSVAYLGVGLSAWLRSRDQQVLARPLERTGLLLPLVPMIGFWASPQQVHYSIVMMIAGLLYGMIAMTRRSFGYAVVATLVLNAGLWYYLETTADIGFLSHPQMWLVPLSICLLGAAQMCRDRLTDTQLTAIRYIAAIVAYVSSTAEIFLHGVGQAPWLPIALAILSLLGIALGMWLRVRAYLYLGTLFLLIAVLSVIWYAAVDRDQTWIWWVSGIAVGIAILVIFGLIERKRQSVLQALEGLRQWDR